MTKFVYAPNGVPTAYPYDFEKLRADNPDISFPQGANLSILAEYNVFPVTTTLPPDVPINKNLLETSPVLVNEEWIQQWILVDATPEEISKRTKATEQSAEVDNAKLDGWIASLMSMSPTEVEQFIQTNVTDLATARNILSKLGYAVRVLLRREFNI